MAEFTVTPWEVHGEIDYKELMERFGTSPIDEGIMEMISRYAEPHFMLRRAIFYSHRDLEKTLKDYEDGKPFYLYTGRGPSGMTHLGHIMPWIFTKWMQDVFDAELYFQITDDEKFLFKDDLSLEEAKKYAYENILDIIALGFNPEKTHIFLDTEYIHHLYPIAIKVAKRTTFSTAKAVFGLKNSSNIGQIFYTSMQSATAFLGSELRGEPINCIVPCGIDQDPHFRVARDAAPFLGYPKTTMMYCKLFPSLLGGDKMSSSVPEATIYTTDTPREVKRKVGKALTGGAVSVEEQRKNGGNPDRCMVYRYFYYMFEPDDEKLKRIHDECVNGERLCGECKMELTEKINAFLKKHQEKREEARERVEEFMLRD